MPERNLVLNLVLEPLKFMEFSLQDTTQGCVIGRSGACIVNLPAALMSWFLENGQLDTLASAWSDALGRGQGWRRRATEGRDALLRLAPELAKCFT